MSAGTLGGPWNKVRGRVQRSWGELTEGDLDEIDGREDALEAKLQERYGLEREEAQRQIRDFRRRCGC